MPLTNCPECGRQVSTEAESCPQCGHPLRAAEGPKCYACTAAATTRCQSCGALSCAQHLKTIYVSVGPGRGYELRCERCYSSAATRNVVFWVILAIFLVVFPIVMLLAIRGR